MFESRNRRVVADAGSGFAVRSGVTQPVIVTVCAVCFVVDVVELVVGGFCGVCAESTAVVARMPQHTLRMFFIMSAPPFNSAVRVQPLNAESRG